MSEMLRAPLDGPLVVTWAFGANSDDPLLEGVTHQGSDLRARVGTPVYAGLAGRVVRGNQWDRGFGLYVRLEAGQVTLRDQRGGELPGDVVLYYAHLSRVRSEGWVERGELIGWSGDTGFTTGAHLHVELVVDGLRYDPMEYVEADMDAAEGQRLAALEAAIEARFTLEDRVVRALNRADDLEAEAQRVRAEVRRLLADLVNTTDGLAYRVEVLLGGPTPTDWQGS